MAERRIPTGRRPAGLQDTATERILNVPHPPTEYKIDCSCSSPCPVCQCREVSSEIIGGTLHRFNLEGITRDLYFFQIGELQDKIAICVGCASGEIIHRATGCAVAVCFDTYNLMSVAEHLRTAYPAVKIIIGADDDYNDKDNPGMAEATEAALFFNDCLLAVPAIKARTYFDFYSMSMAEGHDAVRLAIEGASAPTQEWGQP